MLLKPVAGGPILPPLTRQRNARRQTLAGLTCSALVTLLITGPWLWANGYLFGTDWPGPRHFVLPSEPSAWAPLQVALAATSALISPEVAARLLVVAIVFAAALLAFRAVPAGALGGACGACVYVFN